MFITLVSLNFLPFLCLIYHYLDTRIFRFINLCKHIMSSQVFYMPFMKFKNISELWFCFCSVPGSWLPLYRWFNVCSSKVLPPSQVLPTWEPSPYSQLESGRSLFRLVLWFVLCTFPKCSSYLSRYSLILNLPSQADLRTSLTATLKSSFSWVSQTCLSSSASLYC